MGVGMKVRRVEGGVRVGMGMRALKKVHKKREC